MERKHLILLLGTTGLVLLILSAMMVAAVVQFVRGGEPTPTPVKVNDVTLCDLGGGGLCVVSFGADNLNQMVINFHLPQRKYPAFYARVDFGESSEVYSCQVVKEIPTSAYCTGPRTPLGGAIVIKIFRSDNDALIAQGDFVVAAIMLPTLPIPGATVEAGAGTPSTPEGTPSGAGTPPRFEPTPTRRAPGPTPTLPPGYPNPP